MKTALRDAFGLRTVRKKAFFLSKVAGGALVLFYLLTSELPIGHSVAFFIWLLLLCGVILAVDFLLGRFITQPVSELNASAARMAKLDFSSPCRVQSDDEFGELAASLNALSQGLQQALAQLHDANARLEEDVRRERRLLAERKDLIDSLSHEVKTPLCVIRAYAEGMQDAPEADKQRQYAQVIVAETQRVNRLITTLLDLSALEAGAVTLSPERFDFVEFVEAVAGRLLMDAPDVRFQVDYTFPDEPVFVLADKARLEQAVDNLLVNAKKNTAPGGLLRLDVKKEGGCVRFSVFNAGPTIPPDILPLIWTKFYRAQGAGYAGSGLGLAIVAQVLSMHKIAYGAKNHSDGVEFFFSIPVNV